MEYILSLSYGKDSIACLGAIEHLGWPLDRIVTADVWATDTIPADLPPMVEFKEKADEIVKARWGIEVEHVRGKWTYEDCFHRLKSDRAKHNPGEIRGWPFTAMGGAWCQGDVKLPALRKMERKGAVSYLGIAADEPERLARLDGIKKVSPLAAIGWTESDCRRWCEDNGLLSPIYTTETRGGCWFCHNQGVGQLRRLRKNYPEYWAMMLKWDADSPVTFHADGHTVRDYERRFHLEDDGLLYPDDKRFRWDMLEKELNYRWF